VGRTREFDFDRDAVGRAATRPEMNRSHVLGFQGKPGQADRGKEEH
jgi:hypothetical protein